MDATRRSIGVPSWVALVRYTPRSQTGRSAGADANIARTNSTSRGFRPMICCGNAKIFARRRRSRSAATRSSTSASRRSSRRSNSPLSRAAASPPWDDASGNVAPHTCSRPDWSKSSKNSLNPAIRSHLVTSRYTGKPMRNSWLSSANRALIARTCSRRSASDWVNRSWMLIAISTPLIGRRFRTRAKRRRKERQPRASASRSESCVV